MTGDEMTGEESFVTKRLRDISRAKYEQNAEARKVLLATYPAQLWYIMNRRGKPSILVRFKFLERVRDEFLKGDRKRSRVDVESTAGPSSFVNVLLRNDLM